jgi:hypothetical protein
MKARSSQRQLLRAVMPLAGCLAAALSLLGSGCATGPGAPAYVTHPPPPSEEVRAGLGVITVVVTEPQSTEIAQPMDKGLAAGKGASGGFLMALESGVTSGDANAFVGSLFLAPVAAAGGAIYGAFAGMNENEYKRITMALRQVVLTDDVPARLESGCVEAIRRLAPRTVLAPTNAPAGTAQTTLEVVPLMFGLDAGAGINPPMTLNCAVQVRFVRASDGAVLYLGQFGHFGATDTLRRWAADDGAKFRQGITAACNDLVGQIAERVFLVYALPGGFAESRILPCDTQK